MDFSERTRAASITQRMVMVCRVRIQAGSPLDPLAREDLGSLGQRVETGFRGRPQGFRLRKVAREARR